jgi:hypothetical protein
VPPFHRRRTPDLASWPVRTGGAACWVESHVVGREGVSVEVFDRYFYRDKLVHAASLQTVESLSMDVASSRGAVSVPSCVGAFQVSNHRGVVELQRSLGCR